MSETISVYQELIPLSDNKYDKPISSNGSYTNPIIMPFAFNTTGTSENIIETVFYIKNNSQEVYYGDLVVCLMKGPSTGTATSGDLNLDAGTFAVNGITIPFEPAYEYTNTGTVSLVNKYKSTYTPVLDDGTISVKLSYGYDELSYIEWQDRKSVLYIPHLGTSGSPDTQYKPVRMRITWKGTPSMLTIRDYFIDVSYATQANIIGV